MKTIMCCLALIAMAMSTSAAFAQEPTLASVEAQFNTTKDNKNGDSKLDSTRAEPTLGSLTTKLLSGSLMIPRSRKNSSAVS